MPSDEGWSGGVLGRVGGTPLVELTRLDPTSPFRTFAKLEALNPGGSIKDRAALEMMRGAIRSGRIVPGHTMVVESSSGNLGIGLAQVCGYAGVRFRCIVDPRTNRQNIAIMRAFGAEVEMVTDTDPATGEYLPARIRRVRELVAREENVYWPNQYANPLNPRAHRTTMREIVEAMPGRLDFLFCSTSSCGTLRGCAEYARAHGLATTIVAVDAAGSGIFGPPVGSRLIPGHGAAVRPALYQDGLADVVLRVDDLDCVVACRTLAAREAILAGGSSGAVVAALNGMRELITPDAICALVFPDRGERYLDTIYNDEWVVEHFGDVAHMWKESTAGVA